MLKLDFDKSAIREYLRAADAKYGSVRAAAKALGIPKSTIHDITSGKAKDRAYGKAIEKLSALTPTDKRSLESSRKVVRTFTESELKNVLSTTGNKRKQATEKFNRQVKLLQARSDRKTVESKITGDWEVPEYDADWWELWRLGSE